ncbi:MAG: hypothetical protein ACXAEI_02020 [Candidatus Hodarchaeales archaeon]|jgi:hypothetical protein
MVEENGKEWFERQCGLWEDTQIVHLRLAGRLILSVFILYSLGAAMICLASIPTILQEDEFSLSSGGSLISLIGVLFFIIVFFVGSTILSFPLLRSFTKKEGQEWFDRKLLEFASPRRFLNELTFSSETDAKQWWRENQLWTESGPPKLAKVVIIFLFMGANFVFLVGLYLLLSNGYELLN